MVVPGRSVVFFGGGLGSVAVLVLLARQKRPFWAIVMPETGAERRASIEYRDGPLAAWLARQSFPPVTAVRRWEVGPVGACVPRDSLADECRRLRALPSAARGWRTCAATYKGDAWRWWLDSQAFAHEEWTAGRRVTKILGYSLDEERRARPFPAIQWEAIRVALSYPLVEARLDTEACAKMILDEGLPIPPRPSCTCCPLQSLGEWEALRRDEPDRFAEAVEISRLARGTPLDVVGLLRACPQGRRQLHVWVDGGYPDLPSCDEVLEEEVPCECAL